MFRRRISSVLIVMGACFFAAGGCRSGPPAPWSVVADNRSDVSCEVEVNAEPGPHLNAPDLGGPEKRILGSGGGKLVIHAVKVVHKRKEHLFNPELEVPAGRSFLVLVKADGTVSAALAPQ